MTFYKLTRRAMLTAIAGGAATAVTVSGRTAYAGNSPKIVFGTIPITPLIGSYVGTVDYFKDEGLEVEITRFNNFAPILQAMAAGNLIAADIGIVASIIALSRGLPIIAPFLSAFNTPSHPLERIMVLPNSPIRTLDDLKGKKLAFLGRGTVPDMMLGALPKKTKIRKEDIELVPLPAPNMPDALAQGLVDAIFAIPPADTVAERKYHARTIANATELVPYAGLSTVVVRRDFAENNPEAAQKLYRALIRFCRWIDDNPSDAREAAARNLGLPTDLAAQMRIPPFSRNGLPVMPSVWNLYAMMVEANTIERHPDPASLFNAGIIEPTKHIVLPVVEKLGLQSDPDMQAMLTGDYPFLTEPPQNYSAGWEQRLPKS